MTEMMNAWVADGAGGIAFKSVPVPVPAADQALIKCYATTLARGEIRALPYIPSGHVLGLDLAGVVIQAAADGSGPPVGSRVIAMTGHAGGGWGELAALPAATLGVIPESLSWAQAAVLPNQGLTAAYTVQHAGLLIGKRVLITGVTGGVARIAAQLALLAGAEVTGTVSRAERIDAVKSLGLAHIALGSAVDGPFDLVVETIGGAVLSRAMEVVGPEGVVVTMGGCDGFDAQPEPAVIPSSWFYQHPGARLQAENVGHRVIQRIGVAQKLETLAQLVASQKIHLDVETTLDWRDAASLVQELQAGAAARRVALIIESSAQP